MTDYTPNRTATIAENASLSSAIEIGDAVPVAIQLPAEWTTANITLQASMDGSTFGNVYKTNGADELVITAAASVYVVLTPADIIGLRGAVSIKIRSGTAGSPVNQAAARSISVLLMGL